MTADDPEKAARKAAEKILEASRCREVVDRRGLTWAGLNSIVPIIRAALLAWGEAREREARDRVWTDAKAWWSFFPSCNGKWISGSGGHRMHLGGCEQVATWAHPDDCYSYCDDHVPAQDKAGKFGLTETPWAEAIRRAFGGGEGEKK